MTQYHEDDPALDNPDDPEYSKPSLEHPSGRFHLVRNCVLSLQPSLEHL
jgi:hypothetical protein